MIVLYPSYSFETLSADRNATEADELLDAWTAVFHPALIEKFNEIPRWESASIPPYNTTDQPILIPPCCESFLYEDWFKQQEETKTVLVRNCSNRNEIIAELFSHAKIEDHGFDAEYIADFFALGTAYFLIDMLVRQLHYMSMPDDSQLTTQIFDSLKAYRKGEIETAKDHLRQAFESICQSKEYFYPSKTYFLDLTLVTSSTTGISLQKILDGRNSVNLFLSCKLLQQLPERNPETFSMLKSACNAGKVRFIVDDSEEKSLLLLPILDVADRILDGISLFREQLNVSPVIYGRLHTGLTPFLPQLLKLAGIKGVVHFAPLDGWRIKETEQSKMIWQGVDGTKIDALVRYPLDGSSNLEFFDLAVKLGQTINNDHAPTSVFAQFPGQKNKSNTVWLDDLRCMANYTPALGEFYDIEKYFDETPQCGNTNQFGFGKYPGNALNGNETNPISYWNNIYKENVQRLVHSVFETILTLLGCPPQDDGCLTEQFAEIIASTGIRNDHKNGNENNVVKATKSEKLLLLNPLSCPRRVFVDISDWKSLPAEMDPVVLTCETENCKEVVVDIPPLGYAFIESNKNISAKDVSENSNSENSKTTFRFTDLSSPKSLASRFFHSVFSGAEATPEVKLIRKSEDDLGKNIKRSVYLLENEYFSVKIDAASGMLRSIFTNNSRFNRLSRQLGFRLPKDKRIEDERPSDDPNHGYAIQTADKISVAETSPITGRLAITGRLVLPNGKTVADFIETITIRRKSRLLEFDLELKPYHELGENSWDSYYAVRYAWNDNTLDLRGGLADGVHTLSGERLQSPKFIDLRNENFSLTFFTEGLPFHRRFGERQLDTILIAKGETISAKKFRFGIGVDLKQPVSASLEFLIHQDSLIVPVSDCPKNPSSWLFQIEAKNVVALYWQPISENDKPIGFKVFLLETEGKHARFAFHLFRTPIKAAATNLLDENNEDDKNKTEIKEFKINGDAVLIEMHGHELLPLKVLFQ
jgi:alpha-mannosidase